MGIMPAGDRLTLLSQPPKEPDSLSFTESVDAAWTAASLTERSDSLSSQLQDATQKSLARARDLGLNPPEFPSWTWSNRITEVAAGWLDANEGAIQSLRSPENGPEDPFLKTGQEIRAEATQRVEEARAREARAGIAGSLFGTGAALMTDVPNLAVMALVPGVGAAEGILMKLGVSAVTNIGAEALSQAASLPAKESAGITPTVGETVLNLTLAGAGGTLLDGLAIGAGKLAGRAGGMFHGQEPRARRAGILSDYRAKVREGRIVPDRMTQAAADAIQDHLDTVPPGRSPLEERLHLETTSAAVEVLQADHPILEDAARRRLDERRAAWEAERERNGAAAAERSRAIKQELVAGQKGLSLDQLYERVPAAQADLVARVTQSADKFGGEVIDHGFKTRESAIEKLNRSGYPDKPHRLNDLARTRALIASPDQADALFADLSKQSVVIDKGWTRKPSGFFDRKLVVRTENGIVGEVQISTPELNEAEKLAHPIYEKQRALERDGKVAPEDLAMHRELGNQQEKIYVEAISRSSDQMREIYASTPQSANSSRKASRVSSSPEWRTSVGEVGRQSDSSSGLKMADMPLPGETMTLAGEKSHSKYLTTSDSMDETVPQRVTDPQAIAAAEERAAAESAAQPGAAPAATGSEGDVWHTETADHGEFTRATEERPDLKASWEAEDGTVKTGNAREAMAKLDDEQKTLREILHCILTPDVKE